MKRKKIIAVTALLLVLLLLPSAVLSAGFLLPPVYGNTFMAELPEMVSRLDKTEGKKIIIVGGSSVAFGVDAGLLSRAVGLPVVNFGLYAALGTKAMLDMSLDGISEGDLVVIAAEENAQTYSLFFGAEAFWQAADGNFSLLSRVSGSDGSALVSAFWDFASSKLKYYGKAPNPSGIYNISSFDENGYISAQRPYNIMKNGYDGSSVISLVPDIISSEYIGYINEYTAKVREKGAEVVFGFAPMNEDALDPATTLESLNAFTAFIVESFDCGVLSDPNDYLYRSGYFYDTNFHMNSAGAVLHTARLVDDITEYLGTETLVDIAIPEEPDLPEPDDTEPPEYDENEKYFIIEDDGYNVTITGVSEAGKSMAALTTPVSYNGKFVTATGTGAFSGSAAREIYITPNIGQMANGTFSGAASLEKVYLSFEEPGDCTVDSMSYGLTEGMAPEAKFIVGEGRRFDYISNYFWGIYSDRISEK